MCWSLILSLMIKRENSVTVACGVNEECLTLTPSTPDVCQSRCLDDVYSGNISLVTTGIIMTLADVLVTMSSWLMFL